MKKIEFAADFDYIDIIKPARSYIPEWYKQTPVVSQKGPARSQEVKTFKSCMPFMDSMMSGYIVELWCDIEIIKENGMSKIYWRDGDVSPMSFKPAGSKGFMPVPNGYGGEVFNFMHNMYLKTPKGYSLLFTQPLNRNDLPFLALSGIVDGDREPIFPGGYPLFLRDGFEGIVKKGTPLIQIIPIRRESWKVEYSQKLKTSGHLVWRKAGLYLDSWYKKNAWFRKSYE
jgi:hypothetical protein